MNSWRTSTQSQYNVYLKRFVFFFRKNKIAFEPSLHNGLRFLTHLHETGSSYNQIAMARSALSALIDIGIHPYSSFGQHPFVKRFIKGIFELKPVLPKFSYVWDVHVLLDFFRKGLQPHQCTLHELGKKLAILLALLSGGQRAQTIHSIDVFDIKIVGGHCVIPLYEKLKQTRPGHHLKPLEFSVYLQEPKLCIVTLLKEYLKQTAHLRTHSKLFIGSQKPHQAVSKSTISRWCKDMMSQAGIDTAIYTSHSSRSAATSYLSEVGVSLKSICDSAGWSSEKTFVAHYKKIVNRKDNIMTSILDL